MDIKWLITAFAGLGKLCFYYTFHHSVTSITLELIIRCLLMHYTSLFQINVVLIYVLVFERYIERRQHVINMMMMLGFLSHRDVSMHVVTQVMRLWKYVQYILGILSSFVDVVQ